MIGWYLKVKLGHLTSCCANVCDFHIYHPYTTFTSHFNPDFSSVCTSPNHDQMGRNESDGSVQGSIQVCCTFIPVYFPFSKSGWCEQGIIRNWNFLCYSQQYICLIYICRCTYAQIIDQRVPKFSLTPLE